jgi:hypothetical protein
MFPLSILCYSNGQWREPAAVSDCCAAGSHLTTPSNIDSAIGLVRVAPHGCTAPVGYHDLPSVNPPTLDRPALWLPFRRSSPLTRRSSRGLIRASVSGSHDPHIRRGCARVFLPAAPVTARYALSGELSRSAGSTTPDTDRRNETG